jgi:predicted PurR-regulated permease PerM
MITVPRKLAGIIALIIFVLTMLGSIIYFTNSTYKYLAKLENKFQQVRSLYRNIERLSQESKKLEELKNMIINTSNFIVEEEIASEDLKSKLSELFSGKLVPTSYMLIKSSSDDPIIFKKEKVSYTLIFKGKF